jgi:hypothetical protein
VRTEFRSARKRPGPLAGHSHYAHDYWPYRRYGNSFATLVESSTGIIIRNICIQQSDRRPPGVPDEPGALRRLAGPRVRPGTRPPSGRCPAGERPRPRPACGGPPRWPRTPRRRIVRELIPGGCAERNRPCAFPGGHPLLFPGVVRWPAGRRAGVVSIGLASAAPARTPGRSDGRAPMVADSFRARPPRRSRRTLIHA